MNINLITDKHNYDNGYISLVNLHFLNLPEEVKVDDYTLLKKSEFHISIMAVKNLAPMISSDDIEQASQQLKQDFLEFARDHSIENFHLTGEYRLVKRDERITIVAMVSLENTDELFDYLRLKHGVDFPTQPTHITMYTLQLEAGIGVFSQADLAQDSVIVDVPALANTEVEYVKQGEL